MEYPTLWMPPGDKEAFLDTDGDGERRDQRRLQV